MVDYVARLTLYIAGSAPKSQQAVANVRQLTSKYAAEGNIDLSIVDLAAAPSMAMEKNILALPTLVRDSPEPPLRVVGDLSDVDRVWSVLTR